MNLLTNNNFLRRGLSEKESFVGKQHDFERNLAANCATSVRRV